MEYSQFMNDNTEGNGKAEIVMDYVLSWSLRQAASQTADKQLLHYCRYMLHKLLQIEQPLEQIIFTDVKVWKEWRNIDLCVEVRLTNNGIEEHYALIIENKYYTPLHNTRGDNGIIQNQLQVYKDRFDKYYNVQGSQWIKRYALLTCYEKDDRKLRMYDEAQDFNFVVFPFYDILDNAYWNEETQTYTDTASDIFNEFWLRKW